MKRVVGVGLALACASAILLGSAGAHHQDFNDPNDVKGRVDLRRIQTWGKHSRMGFQLSTFGTWRPRGIWDAGFFIVNVDTFGTSRADYYAMVRSDGSRMKGMLFRDRRHKRDYVIGPFRVWRPNMRSVKFRFPWKRVRFPESRSLFRWNAQSLYTSDNCPAVCIDLAPDDGVMVETVVRPSPSPSVTPTDTPTP